MELSDADKVWNRAAGQSAGAGVREGDLALKALLSVHSMICSGGIEHAVDVLGAEQFAAGASGYRYFGLDEVADLLTGAVGASEDELEAADDRYGDLVPLDSTLVDYFKAVFTSAPESFAPLNAV